MTEKDTRFAQWLQETRVANRLDLSSLAQLSGVDRSTINRLERAVTQPTICTAVRLCDALDTDVDKLVSVIQERRISPAPKRVSTGNEDVLTIADLNLFVQIYGSDALQAYDLLANWMNVVAATKPDRGDRRSVSRAFSDMANGALEFERRDIEKIFGDIPFLQCEIAFPPEVDGPSVLQWYEKGGAITLGDVGSYIRYQRHLPAKSNVRLTRPGAISSSALSRLETGTLQQIRLVDVMQIDSDLDEDGTILRMGWQACQLSPETLRQKERPGDPKFQTSNWNEKQLKLALAMLAVSRWWVFLQPTNPSLVRQMHEELNRFK